MSQHARTAVPLPPCRQYHSSGTRRQQSHADTFRWRQISLDDAANGHIAEQEGARIVKADSGQLVYQKTSYSGPLVYNTLTTPRGGKCAITLPDGTKAWLNASSSLRYPVAFTGSGRTVQLTGEGYFEVAKDPAHPFEVTTGTTSVKVLGTAFDIMAYPEEHAIRTTLLNGSVQVSKDKTVQLLRPEEQAVLNNGTEKFSVVHPDLDQVMAWKNGLFNFEDADIPSIMRQVARWYDVEIRYKGDVSNLSLSGIVSRRENVDFLLDALARAKTVQFKREGNTIIVMPANAQ